MKSRSLLFIAAILLALHISTAAQVASGGPYALEKTVIASGGGKAMAGNYSVEKTIGQAVAGTTSTGGTYTVAGGFWTAGPMAPTAANATIRGLVKDRVGRGVAGAVVYLSGGTLTAPRTVSTNTSGQFIVRDVPVGQFYVLYVRHRRYTFFPDQFALDLVDDLDGIEFQVAEIP